MLFEILDHRIAQAPEINGVVNTSYMSLDEHLVIYYVNDVYNVPKVG